jgi:hypothetical protein
MNYYLCPQGCTVSQTVMLPHGYALTWTWTDKLTINNETGAIFLHLLLLHVWKIMTAPYGWGQLQIAVLLVTLITNKPPLIIHVLNNLNIHGWTKNDCHNTAETTVQLPHRFLAIVPPCTQVMAKTFGRVLSNQPQWQTKHSQKIPEYRIPQSSTELCECSKHIRNLLLCHLALH